MICVVYYWVSTNRQGEVNMDVDDQRAEVARYVSYNQGKIAAEYTEVLRGRRCDWPKLAEAIAHAQQVGGRLVIAKLDRWVKNAGFTAMLHQSGVEFVCCDEHSVCRETIHLLAALADKETKRVSVQMKAALSAAKERGVKLGSARENHWEGREDRRREGIRKGLPRAAKAAAEARSRKAQEAYNGLLPQIIKMREEEGLTLAEIAQRVNAEGHKTTAGLPFTATMIIRLLKRAGTTNREPAALPPADFSDLPLFCQGHNPAGAAQM